VVPEVEMVLVPVQGVTVTVVMTVVYGVGLVVV